MIHIYEPYLNKKTNKWVHDAIDSTWISSQGKYLDLVKEKLCDINKRKYVILTNNGTTACHLMAIGLNKFIPSIKNIICPNNVYVAAWNAFLMGPKYNLIPFDCNLETWNMNLKDLDDRYDRTETAILIVHNIGNIMKIPENYFVIEDNCEGFLGEYDGQPSGSKSLMSAVSFFGNKTLTCGEGGALFTDNDDIYDFLDSTAKQGYTKEKFIFDKLGYNYRMTNIEAAILWGQLEYMDEIKEKKQHIFDRYRKNLNSWVDFQKVEEGTKHSNWMFGIKVTETKKLSLSLFNQGVETRPMFPPMSYHEHLKRFAGVETNAKLLYDSCLILPSHPNLTNGDIDYICNLIKKNLM